MLTHNTSKSACTQYVGQDMVCGYIQTKWRERTYLIMLGTDGQEPLPAAWLLLRLYVMSCRRIIQQSCDRMRRALQHRVSPLDLSYTSLYKTQNNIFICLQLPFSTENHSVAENCFSKKHQDAGPSKIIE